MAKKAAVAIAIVDDDYSKAVQKASDPNMTTKNNPLAHPECAGCNPAIVDRNMERLYEDARMRRNPASGAIYSAMMDTRYGG